MKEHNRGQTYQCCDGVGARSNEKMGKENNNTKGGHCGRGFPSRNREACKNLTSLVIPPPRGVAEIHSGFGRPEVQPGAPRKPLASGLVGGQVAQRPRGCRPFLWHGLPRPQIPHRAGRAARGACRQPGRGAGAPGPSLMITRDLTFPAPGGHGGPGRKPPGRAQPVCPVGPGGTRAPGRCPGRHLPAI